MREGGEEQLVPGTERALESVCIYNWIEDDKHMLGAEKRYQKNAQCPVYLQEGQCEMKRVSKI